MSFIVLEGIDGAGTTTQAQRIGEALRARGLDVLVTREPSDGPVGQKIRQLLKSGAHEVDQLEMARLFAEDRLEHLAREIDPALAKGRPVVCDRYVLSSCVYQSRYVPTEQVWKLNERARAADLTLFVDVSAEVAQTRRHLRGGAAEMYEQLELQRFFVAQYRALPAWMLERERCVRVDGERSPDEVFADSMRHVESCLARRPGPSST
jgi:dTMP kinase